MHTEMTIHIAASLEPIFRLAVEIEHWPKRLPHYRWVTVLQQDGSRRRVEMSARRGWIPVKWHAIQEVREEDHIITYRHVQGPTTGMEVAWTFTPEGDGHLVRIVHDLKMRWPIIGGPVANLIVGPHFVDPIAGLTLRTVKRLAESGWPA